MSQNKGLPRLAPDLDRRVPVIEVVPAGTLRHRVFRRQYDPFHYDRTAHARFNAGDASFGVMYTAVERGGAFAETFLRTVGRTLISEAFGRSEAYAGLPLRRPMRAVRFRGYGLAPVGATASVCSPPS